MLFLALLGRVRVGFGVVGDGLKMFINLSEPVFHFEFEFRGVFEDCVKFGELALFLEFVELVDGMAPS